MRKLTVIIFCSLAFIFQISLNPKGYNYFIGFLIVSIAILLIYNFDTITDITLGKLTIKKKVKEIKAISKHIDNSVIAFYKSSLITVCNMDTCNSIGIGFEGVNVLWSYFNALKPLLDEVDQLPLNIKEKINDEYLYSVDFALKAQKRLLGKINDNGKHNSYIQKTDDYNDAIKALDYLQNKKDKLA
ncbi:hypothetical protein [Francisella adeliensis]|uniref:Uncharacterized protein n=1 Tax=Francisella adeliensis TaxID=2007306 RepID=A0A2Z4XYZ9_9GAMM|nr:hypothetical protein [Francisella adeliensis]AXA34000.1 hypothetical protein CDH04_06025 [Francisella adeliensis]MBK2085913.1 hypothetical protein [Francisella adeliensis]MBK2097791.1 hypothetical protein [Francisella adeliensis]QIW12237.1 hypothetical protein FZC43_06030 [Francisella adeliensis]QIW14113.1 hypothetical protein FZC44_06030 [Francisella adeliensis]